MFLFDNIQGLLKFKLFLFFQDFQGIKFVYVISILVFVLYQISDIKIIRIDYMLKEISEILLCDLLERNLWGVIEFL